MKNLIVLIITILILSLFFNGCGAALVGGMAGAMVAGHDGPASTEEIQKAHWRGWINSLPVEPDKLTESVNLMNLVYNEDFTVKEPGEFFFQKDNLFISQQVFLKLFDTVGELHIEKTFEIKGENIIYLGVEIELLESGKVAKVEL